MLTLHISEQWRRSLKVKGGEVEEETRNSRSGGKTKLVEESIAEIDEVGSMAP